LETLTVEVAWQSLLQYLLGSVVFATAMGLATWGLAYVVIRIFRK
jgi:hypothetical protein